MGADGAVDTAHLDPVTAAWYDEYRFLKAAPGYTHDRDGGVYLDADPRFVRWMLEIDAVITRAQARAERDAMKG